MSDVSFGPEVAIYRFMPKWSLEDATVVGDTVYVVWEKPGYGPHGSYKPGLGSLIGGHLRVIPLPRVYDSLSFVDDRKNLMGIRIGGGLDWYALDNGYVRPIRRPKPAEPTFMVLADGDRCVAGEPDSRVAIYDVDRAGMRRPILSVEALASATKGAMDAPYPVWCTHFHGEDFAFIGGSIGLIFRLDQGHAAILTTGRFVGVGKNDVLIQDINYELLQAHVVSD